MNKTPPARGRRGPHATFDGDIFHVEIRGRAIDVPALAGEGDDEVLVELDGVTHWALAEGESEPQEISIEDLGAILEAIESAADEAGLSISFD